MSKNKNKLVKKVEVKVTAPLIEYSFPAYGITIMAEDFKQAELKLHDIIDKKGRG